MSMLKKIVMSVVATGLFFGLLELILWLAGVEPRLYAEDPYVGFSSHSPLFVANADGTQYQTADNKLNLFNRQSFAIHKPNGVKRVFCVGGSTTNGRPYDDATSFCGWLRELLPAAVPSTSWEVINAGGVSYASYRVALLMEELAKYEPDLFLIYSGHNEFLEERTYRDIIRMPRAVRGLGGMASRTRTHALVSRVVDAVSAADDGEVEAAELTDAVSTRLDKAIGPSEFTRDDTQQQRIIEHFRYNLARMVDIARSAGADVLMVVPASNLANCTPFKAEHRSDLTEAEMASFDEAVARARQAASAGDLEPALGMLQEAAEIDRRYATVSFLEGRVLQSLGRFGEAKAAFQRARDDDVCPLRMLGPMADIVRQVATDRNVPLVDFERIVEKESPNGIAGGGLFLDHVHPTIEGHLLLARSILETMAESGLVRPAPDWSGSKVEEVREAVFASIDSTDHGLALMRLSKVLGWAGKLTEAFELAQRAVALAPDDVAIQYQAGLTAHMTGRRRQAVAHYQRAIELQPDADLPRQNLGVLLKEAGRPEEAAVQFRKAIEYARTEATRRENTENLAQALVMIGFLHYREGRFEDAERSFAESNALLPGSPDTLARLGLAQMAAGRRPEAVASLEQAAAVAPENAALHNRLAVAYASNNQMEEANRAWQRAVELDPEIGGAPDAFPKVMNRARQPK